MIKIIVLTKSSLTFAQQETVANYILTSSSVCDFKYRLPISWFVSKITQRIVLVIKIWKTNFWKSLVICSSEGFTNILTLRINKIECRYLHSQYIRINKQNQCHEIIVDFSFLIRESICWARYRLNLVLIVTSV